MVQKKIEKILRVINSKEYSCNEFGVLFSHKYNKTKKLDGSLTPDGYRHYCICFEGSQFTVFGHQFVFLSFNPNADLLKLQINHKDTDKSNNRLDNLELSTGKQNINHAILNGSLKSFKRKVTDDQIRQIKVEKDFTSICNLAIKYKLTRKAIRYIIKKEI